MRTASIVLATILLGTAAQAQTAEKDKAVAIGPWQIEASFTEERKFDRCAMSRKTEDGIEARFTRDEAGLSLGLSSERWQLEKGKSYAVEFVAGKAAWKSDVAATEDAVRVVVSDPGFIAAIKNANTMEVRGAGATIKVPLDKSSAALARLDACYETNNKALETNPFVKPSP